MTSVEHLISKRTVRLTIRLSVRLSVRLFVITATLLTGVLLEVSANARSINLPPPPQLIPVPIDPPSGPTSPSTHPIPSIQPSSTPASFPNERVYTAPGVTPVLPNFGRYRVYVESDDPFVLQQVRNIQPEAFFQSLDGRRVIQAGAFNNEANARHQLALLSSQGIAARITTSSFDGAPIAGSDSLRGFYVVVPRGRSNLPELRDRAIQLGVSSSAIRLRDRPLGPHMAVGPLVDRREAESLKNYLRGKGRLDARVYYDRSGVGSRQ